MERDIYKTRIVSTGYFNCNFAMYGQISVFVFSGSLLSHDRSVIKQIYHTLKNVCDVCVLDFRGLIDFDETLYALLLSAVAIERLGAVEFTILAKPTLKKRLELSGLAKQFPIVASMAKLHTKIVRQQNAGDQRSAQHAAL